MEKYKLLSNILNKNEIISIKDIVTNSIGDIHNQLFNAALHNYALSNNITVEQLLENNKIIVRKMTTFDMPIEILIRGNSAPYQSTIIDLTPYWPQYYFVNKDKIQLYNKKNNTYNHINELRYIDYANESGNIFNRFTGKWDDVAFKDIDRTSYDTKFLKKQDLLNERRKTIK